MRKISLRSWLFAAVFVVAIIAIGISGTLGFNVINAPMVYTTIMAIGFAAVTNSIVIDKNSYQPYKEEKQTEVKTMEKEMNSIPEMKKEEAIPPMQKPQLQLDEKDREVMKFIVDHLNQGFDLNSVGKHLVEAGYDFNRIQALVQFMIDNKVIVLPKQQQQQTVEQPEKEEDLDVPPEPPKKKLKRKVAKPSDVTKELDEDIKNKKKDEKGKCPKCGKEFATDKKMKRHYGMAHYNELDI